MIVPVDLDLDRLREQLRVDEGTGPRKSGRFLLYKCPAGRWTLGYGRNVEDRGISETTADQMLDEDILHAYLELTSRFYWFDALSPGQASRTD